MRLKTVRPQVGTIRPILAALTPQAPKESWRRDGLAQDFYKTARWQKLRWAVLVRDRFTCQWPGCGRIVADTSRLVADHIIPVRIDPDRKWAADNLRCLCDACHSGPRQAEEIRLYGPASGRGGSNP